MEPNLHQLAIIIPARNEAKVLANTLKNICQYVSPQNIYVVNDGSSDHTAKIARQFTHHVLTRRHDHGKGAAINAALVKWSLAQRYDLIMPLDADTQLTAKFVPAMVDFFERDENKQFICANGRVTAYLVNWLTAYRVWEYEIGQTIHKQAQAILGSIVVCPGCATVYRSHLFQTVAFPTHALAEDMDLTFLVHRQHLGKIGYVDQAEVITQDPQTLRDFIKQLNRWYTGLWQNISKHHVPWGGQLIDLEVALLSTEALFSGLLGYCFIILLPLSLATDVRLFLFPLLIDMFLFIVPTIAFTTMRRRTKRLYLYFGHIYALRLLSSLIFVACFFQVMFDRHLAMHWFSPRRYQLEVS